MGGTRGFPAWCLGLAYHCVKRTAAPVGSGAARGSPGAAAAYAGRSGYIPYRTGTTRSSRVWRQQTVIVGRSARPTAEYGTASNGKVGTMGRTWDQQQGTVLVVADARTASRVIVARDLQDREARIAVREEVLGKLRRSTPAGDRDARQS